MSGEEEKKREMKRALLIIDVQNDFCPGGSLAVGGGDKIIPLINQMRSEIKWDLICLSQDWHPSDHCSFGPNNKGAPLFTQITLPKTGSKQMMWPIHCVQGSKGSEFHPDLTQDKDKDIVVYKGTHKWVDSYSAFFDNDQKTKTDLDDILKKHHITDVVCAGLAFDYCVGFTALDANKIGYKTTVVQDACRSVAPESEKAMTQRINEQKIPLVSTEEILKSMGH
eukprot:CAMPEP_0197543326 /NCGR_PEP_ID=MMETSP1318-20131121/68171_1 /TAXON_ID=552666 /ORGANISM="Partenskyella glossopodia, Strain RCC365" /LENGTH=223 /DNA_ID=CAMNT_0043102651 /DNA_START=86 /DNA_END=757 /DNA_ORIENTATION=+